MQIKGFVRNGVVNLADGEGVKDLALAALPAGVMSLECVGINGFAQSADLYVALGVVTEGSKQIYPLAPSGKMPYSDPAYAWRVFGSERVILRPDPGTVVEVSVARTDTAGEARVIVAVSGSTFQVG